MNYLKFAKNSTHSGKGIRGVLYVSGCRNGCKGCQNPETWCFAAGEPYTEALEAEILDYIKKPYVDGLTLCGGEPGEQETHLASKVKALGKSVWCYTGYWLQDFYQGGKKYCDSTENFLKNIDVLICGPYEQALRDITNNNLYRGSSNQRVLDVQASLNAGTPIMLPGVPNNS